MVTPIFFMNAVNEAAALLFVRGGDFLTVFDKPQRDAFAGLLFPGYEDNVFTYAQPLMMGELAIMLWLMIMGAKPPAAVAATSSSAA